MDQVNRFPKLPERIKGLGELAYNLWWSWHPSAREMFRVLDLQAWRDSEHNPLRMLGSLSPEAIALVAEDREFLARYDGVMSEFEAEVGSGDGWFASHWGHPPAPLAYFSAEYGLHSSLRLYAGGLGILAGDHLKECSDLAAPVVGVGLIYSRGYVGQRIRENGWQDDVESPLDRTYDPVEPVCDDDGERITIRVPLFDPPLHVGVWKVRVGRGTLYLLDPDLASNQPWDRQIAHRLYVSDLEQRLRQEIVLGIGGMEVLRTLGFRPAALHLNEGHPAFSVLERIRELKEEGAGFEEALAQVREKTIFTTHTPVPAGTDVFPFPLMQRYFNHYAEELGTNCDRLLELGINPDNPQAGFNMTVFALRTARYANAVSKRHGEVARKMWAGLWPDAKEGEHPIVAITNGVHLRTWIEPRRIQDLLSRYLGPSWIEHQDQQGIWERVEAIPDKELWQAHENRKASLINLINERARDRWLGDKVAAVNVVALGALLDPRVLTIGFARRFTGYKRPDLVLHDLERLKRLLTEPWRPMQLIFAGKAHPADQDGKRLIQKVVQLAQNPEFAGRIAFVENYDHHLAHYMVAGVDIWLNNPIPPLEASGTSGMKASINGVPQLSILDGWWAEGYNGGNGWSFGESQEGDHTPADAESLYRALEEKIIPLYYERSDDGVPHGFVQVMKEAIKSVAPVFSTRRMVKEYIEQFYVPALGISQDDDKEPMGKA